MMSALSASTRQAARREGTTESGSYVAFNTSALLTTSDPTDACRRPRANSRSWHGVSRSQRSLKFAPREVVQHIGGFDAMVQRAVLGLETKTHIIARRHRDKRRPCPPVRRQRVAVLP